MQRRFDSSWAAGRQEFQSLPQGLFMHFIQDFIQGSLHIDMCKQTLEQGLEFQPLLSSFSPPLPPQKQTFPFSTMELRLF